MEKKYINIHFSDSTGPREKSHLKKKTTQQPHKILITGKEDTFLSNSSLYYCDLYTTVIALHFKQMSETADYAVSYYFSTNVHSH